jgi:hypothetical protein
MSDETKGTDETEAPARKPSIIPRVVVAIAAGALYTYPFWIALGNFINLPLYYLDQFGVTSDKVPWALLVAGIALPVVIFAGSVILTWRRGAGSMALVLTTGFAVVNALALTILAFEKETELRLVIDFLTGA